MLGCVLLKHMLELVYLTRTILTIFFTLRTSAQARDEDIKKIVKSLSAQ